jgi:hypothetical protein
MVQEAFMKCTEWQAEIALHAGRDLPSADVPRVERHVAECADCRALLADLRAEQSAIAQLRDDPLEDAMLAEVRRRVLQEIDVGRRAALVPLFWKLSLAAALVLAVLLAWPKHHPAAKPEPLARAERPQYIPPPAPAPSVARHHRARTHRRAPSAQPSAEPLLVQFLSNDPNIVIYWIVDPKPQGD